MLTLKLAESIERNNLGATLIEKGYYNHAVSQLAVALEASKVCLEQHDKHSSKNDQHIEIDLDEFVLTNAFNAANGSEEGFFVFRQAARIPHLQYRQDANTYGTKVACSAISMFNLALAHHLEGIRRDLQGFLFLKKAARLYQFSLQVFNEVVGSPSLFSSSTTTTIICLALLNNLSDVHRRLGQVEASEKCCEDVLQTLMGGSEPPQSKVTLEAFYENSFFYLLSVRGIKAAPAA